MLRSRSINVSWGGSTGTLAVRNGGVARTLRQGTALGHASIGTHSGGDGQVAVYGTATDGTTASLFDVDDSLWVGDNGLGVLRIGQELDGTANGAGALQVDVDLRIGDDTTNSENNRVVVDGANATANVDNFTYVGLSGTGTLEVTGGAQFTGRFLRVGHNPTSNGTLLIDGAGSLLDTDADTTEVSDDTVIGTNGIGTATVSNGGTLSLGSVSSASFANVDFDAGTLNLTNSGLAVTAVGLFGSLLVIDEDEAINVSSSTSVQADGLLNVARGTFSAGAAVNDGTIVIAEGNADFDADDSSLEKYGLALIDSFRTLTEDQHLDIVGAVTLSDPLQLDGGTLSLGSTNSLAQLQFAFGSVQACTLRLTNSGLQVGTSGLFGSLPTKGWRLRKRWRLPPRGHWRSKGERWRSTRWISLRAALLVLIPADSKLPKCRAT